MTHIHTLITGLVLLASPLSAMAYLTPEQILLSDSVYLPPSARESQERQEAQQKIGADRRAETMERITPKPAAPEEPTTEEEDETTDDTDGLSAVDAELLRTLRVLQRVGEQQAELRLQGNTVMHSGAPPLAPTGPGAVLSAITMIAAGYWTLRRAKKAEAGR